MSSATTATANVASTPNKPVVHELFIDVMKVKYTFKGMDTVAGRQVAFDTHLAIYEQLEAVDLFSPTMIKKPPDVNLAKRIVLEGFDPTHYPVFFYKYQIISNVHFANFISIKFHPEDLGLKGIEMMHIALGSIFEGGWKNFIDHGEISTLEVSVDLHNVSMNSIRVFPPASTKTSTVYRLGKAVETIYYGTSKKPQFSIYDRQSKRAQKTPPQIVGVCTRVEKKFPNASRPLKKLNGLKNPFLPLQMLQLPLHPPVQPSKKKKLVQDEDAKESKSGGKDYIWELFLDSVAQRTLYPALSLLPVERRTLYRKHLQKGVADWWDPRQVWKGWYSYLSKLKLDDPDHFA
jgi:hypothetical protein